MSRYALSVAGFAGVLVLVVGFLAVSAWGAPFPAPSPVAAPGTSFQFGVTHTESWNLDGDPMAMARADAVTRATASVENVHIMGWGTDNPEPSPGVFNFASLDRRMALVRAHGTMPVITLCGAPDWMKGGAVGTTDWSRLGVAPDAAHVADFAQLAAMVARRYPWVKHFQVWSELRGYWDADRNAWDAPAYTGLYNSVFHALKNADPANQVGGPYVVMQSFALGKNPAPSGLAGPWGEVDRRSLDAVDYWLAHRAGADFLAVDGASTSWGNPSMPPAVTNEKLVAVTAWLRTRTTLPIWWSELYTDPVDPEASTDSPERAQAMLDGFRRLRAAGAAVVLLWQPEESPSLRSAPLYTATGSPGGGRALPLATMIEAGDLGR